MKKIFVTQRVEIQPEYQERRDSIDQRWIQFLAACGLVPILLPNTAKLEWYDFSNSGILLTGGNNLVKYGGTAPERDQFETALLELTIARRLPLLGICRGMQLIQDYFAIALQKVNGHIATRHKITICANSAYYQQLVNLKEVNSFHNFGAYTMDMKITNTTDLQPTAIAADQVIMAIEHTSLPIFGQMWHVEREAPFNKVDIAFFKYFFKA